MKVPVEAVGRFTLACSLSGRPIQYSKPHGLLCISCLHTSGQSTRNQPRSQPLSDCYTLLGVVPECTEEDLRTAYLSQAKVYHPDGQSAVRDTDKFVQVQEAYKTVVDHRRSQTFLAEEEAKVQADSDVKHTAPQHRRYLNFEGIGFGTPSQRQQQYKQFRVMQAVESVHEHRVMKHGLTESSLVAKDKVEARKIKISNMIDRVVDDLIRESMQRGDFDNLSGRGKPLDRSDYNPFIDLTTHNINKILVNNGFKPEWIMLSKEIREDISVARQNLAAVRFKLGPPPHSSNQDRARWDFHVDKFRDSVQEINEKIDKFNLIVPFMDKQMAHYKVETILKKVVSNPSQYVTAGIDGRGQTPDSVSFSSISQDEVKIHWREVWSNIKQVFTFR